MSLWTDQMDRLNQLARDSFGTPTSYQRPSFPAFSITGMPEFVDRLENVDQGQFYSVFYRTADFDRVYDPVGNLISGPPFTASVMATFTGPPNSNGTLTIDGVIYTSVFTLNNAVPFEFLRGTTALGAAENLTACIIADPGLAGVFFSSSTTAHPTCKATTVDHGDGTASVIVSAIVAGFSGNLLRVADEMSAINFDKKAFYGGGPLDNDLVTIDGILFRVSDVPEPDPEGEIQIRLEKKAL